MSLTLVSETVVSGPQFNPLTRKKLPKGAVKQYVVGRYDGTDAELARWLADHSTLEHQIISLQEMFPSWGSDRTTVHHWLITWRRG